VLCLFAFSDLSLALTEARPVAVIDLIPHPGGTDMVAVRAKVRGHEGLFLFDTGGGIFYISPAFADTVGCKPGANLRFQPDGAAVGYDEM
jgi:hypothetical protein